MDQGASPTTRYASLSTYWIRIHRHMEQQLGQVYGLDQISAYPTEPGMTFLSAYLVTGKRRYREDFERQLEFAHSLENGDRFLVIPRYPWVSRDYQARHIYNLAISGMLLHEQRYQVADLSSSQLPSGATPFCCLQPMGMPEEEYLPGH